jgi:hypothetical protein
MRRVTRVAFVVGLLSVSGLAPAQAQESQPDGEWAGSTIVPTTRPGCDDDDLCGQFVRAPSTTFGPRSITIYFNGLEAVATSPTCTLPSLPGPEGPHQSPATFEKPLDFECNGTYQATVDATANIGGGGLRLTRTFTVTDPAPEVEPPEATAGAARTVEVSWTALANAPKDFRGYTVLRSSADEGPETLASLPPTETSWVDVAPPAEGGEVTYEVRTRRAGANPTDPTDEVSSSGAAADPVEVEPAPVDPTDPTDPTIPGDPTDPSDPTDPTDPTVPPGPSTPGPANPPASGGGSTPSVQVPRVGTPSRSFFPPLLSPPDTFEEELPFEEPGEEAAVLPDDLSSPFAEPGRGLVIPAAVGLVLAVWAFHLRYLARMAKPQYVEAGDDLPEILQL